MATGATCHSTALFPILVLLASASSINAVCNDISGVWVGHPTHGTLSAPITVTQAAGSSEFKACLEDGGCVSGTTDGAQVKYRKLVGTLAANTALNSTAPPCTRIDWQDATKTYWCREPWCEWVPPAPAPPPPPPPPVPAPPGAMNVLFIACDDLRAQFGRSFQTPEVRTISTPSSHPLTHPLTCVHFYCAPYTCSSLNFRPWHLGWPRMLHSSLHAARLQKSHAAHRAPLSLIYIRCSSRMSMTDLTFRAHQAQLNFTHCTNRHHSQHARRMLT
jgi:hypothetical protein